MHDAGIGRLWGLLFSAVGGYALLSTAAEEVSPAQLRNGYIILAVYLTGTVINVVDYFAKKRRNPCAPNIWYNYFVVQLWLSIFHIIGSLWLFWTSLSDFSRLVFTLAAVITVPISALGTIRPPSYGKRSWGGALLPYSVPVALIPTHVIFGGAIGLNVALVIGATCALIVVMRGSMQSRMNEAFDAMSEAQRNERVAQEAKARFLAAASHDLDQPLQSARLFFDQLVRSPYPEARDAAARSLSWAFDSMQDMVSQVTQFLQLESSAVVVRSEVTSVGPLLARAIEAIEHRARPAGVELKTLPSSLSVIGDRTLIERTLGNFIGNALRHAKATRILVGARQYGDLVRIWVIDDGVGVLPIDRGNLFDDYAQGSDHNDEVRGGFGLGLASARRIAALMGGQVGLEPQWTSGSAFFLELKAA
jgi:signal transduction histidine kinase